MMVGDETAINEFIEANLGFVIVKVEDYIRDYPNAQYLRDDLVSEGNMALVLSAQRAFGDCDEGDKPLAYARMAIYNAISDFAQREMFPQGGSARTIRDSLSAEKSVPKQTSVDRIEADAPESNFDELKEEILAVCENHEERQIVHFREQGKLDSQIATILGYTLDAIHRTRRDIYARFLNRTGIKGEV